MQATRFATAGKTQRPLPAFFYRLSARAQRTYLKSDSIDRYAMPSNPAAVALTRDLVRILEDGAISAVAGVSNALGAELCGSLRVPPIRIEVRGVRPHNARGELHGIFYVRRPPLIVLWMRTAKHHAVVKPRTFLRTLLHELGHYADFPIMPRFSFRVLRLMGHGREMSA